MWNFPLFFFDGFPYLPLLLLSLLTTGGSDADASGKNHHYQTAVLQLEPSTLSWRRVGELQQARTWHRTSVVRMERLQQRLCGVKTPPTTTTSTTTTVNNLNRDEEYVYEEFEEYDDYYKSAKITDL